MAKLHTPNIEPFVRKEVQVLQHIWFGVVEHSKNNDNTRMKMRKGAHRASEEYRRETAAWYITALHSYYGLTDLTDGDEKR